jgi:hypothetical protein
MHGISHIKIMLTSLQSTWLFAIRLSEGICDLHDLGEMTVNQKLERSLNKFLQLPISVRCPCLVARTEGRHENHTAHWLSCRGSTPRPAGCNVGVITLQYNVNWHTDFTDTNSNAYTINSVAFIILHACYKSRPHKQKSTLSLSCIYYQLIAHEVVIIHWNHYTVQPPTCFDLLRFLQGDFLKQRFLIL